MTDEQLKLLRAIAKWFSDNQPTAVLPGRKDTAINDIVRELVRNDSKKTSTIT